jgi:hypothetical protein
LARLRSAVIVESVAQAVRRVCEVLTNHAGAATEEPLADLEDD